MDEEGLDQVQAASRIKGKARFISVAYFELIAQVVELNPTMSHYPIILINNDGADIGRRIQRGLSNIVSWSSDTKIRGNSYCLDLGCVVPKIHITIRKVRSDKVDTFSTSFKRRPILDQVLFKKRT